MGFKNKLALFSVFIFLLVSGIGTTVATTNTTGVQVNQTSAVIGDNTGTLTGTGDEVQFLLDTDPGQEYLLSLTSADTSTDFDIDVDDPDGFTVATATGVSYPDETSFTGNGGEYTITVYSFSGSGDFTLNLALGDTVQSVVEGENSGNLTDLLVEYWLLETEAGADYELTLNGPDGSDFDMTVYDSDGNSLASATSTSYPDTVEVTGDGTSYLIEVYAFTGSGDYTLEVEKLGGGDDNGIPIPLFAIIAGIVAIPIIRQKIRN